MQNFPQGSPQCVAAPAGFSLPRCFGNGNELDWQRTVTLLIRYCSGSAAKQFRRGFQRHAPGLMFFELCECQPQDRSSKTIKWLKAGRRCSKRPARTIQRTSSEQCPARAQARQAAQTARDKGRECRWITAARLSARTLSRLDSYARRDSFSEAPVKTGAFCPDRSSLSRCESFTLCNLNQIRIRQAAAHSAEQPRRS